MLYEQVFDLALHILMIMQPRKKKKWFYLVYKYENMSIRLIWILVIKMSVFLLQYYDRGRDNGRGRDFDRRRDESPGKVTVPQS